MSRSSVSNLSAFEGQAEEPLIQSEQECNIEVASSSSVSHTVDQVPELFCCPITRDLMLHPVLLVESGQVFEREAIINWIESGKDSCPVTGTQLQGMTLQTIFPLRSAIHEWAKQHGVVLQGMQPWIQLKKQRLIEQENSLTNLRNMRAQSNQMSWSRCIRSCLGWFHLGVFIVALMYLCTVLFYLALEGLQVAQKNVSDLWGEWLMVTAMVALTYTAFGLITFCATAQCCDNLVNGPTRFLSPPSDDQYSDQIQQL